MAYSTIIKNIVKEQLLTLHVAYIAKVLSVKNDKAKIQPLGKFKEYGQDARAYAPLENVPIANNAKFKIINKDIFRPIAKDDIVLCICCDRNVTAALRGENSLPPIGNFHDISNSIIVAIM